jgi:hypothetical protein
MRCSQSEVTGQQVASQDPICLVALVVEIVELVAPIFHLGIYQQHGQDQAGQVDLRWISEMASGR